MQSAAATDRGLVRQANEDSILADAGAGVFIVADGMGGHRAGEVASRIAVSTIFRLLRDAPPELLPAEALRDAIAEANRTIHEEASRQEALRGMGTTVVVALARDAAVWIAHAGDSRAYLFNAAGLAQLTEDHSLVAAMVRRGEIAPEAARTHPMRNVVSRCLGTEPSVQADIRPVFWEPGDILLLCSDGLTGMLEDSEIAALIRAGDDDLEAICQSLIEAANLAGGRDNISAVMARNEG